LPNGYDFLRRDVVLYVHKNAVAKWNLHMWDRCQLYRERFNISLKSQNGSVVDGQWSKDASPGSVPTCFLENHKLREDSYKGNVPCRELLFTRADSIISKAGDNMIGNVLSLRRPLIVFYVILAGCQVPLGGNQNPSNPVIKDRVKTEQPHIFSLIAARRMIFVNPDPNVDKARVCTEPPPDASENVSNAIAGAMTVAATQKTGQQVSAAVNMASALDTF
jgi:hypothetical protein